MSFIKTMITGPDKIKGPNEEAFNLEDYSKNQRQIDKRVAGFDKRKFTQIDTKPQDQFRQGQTTLAGQLADQMSGKAPSLAQMQMRQGQENNVRNAMAMAASGAPNQAGATARNFARAVMEGGQAANRDAGMMRAAEQAQTANTLSNVLSQGRQTDIGLAQSQAQLTAQQRAQLDGLIQQYLAMGMSLDAAQSQARMDLEKTKIGVASANSAAQAQHMGGMLSFISSGAQTAATAFGGGGKK